MGKINLTGQKFGRLVVLEDVGRGKDQCVLWRCRCDCGKECVVSSRFLRCGHTKSCGCLQRDRAAELKTTHGLHKHPLYSVWACVMVRTGVWKCSSGQVRRDYIERGISICEEWKTFENFYEWSIAHGYAKGLQIDRIDNDGDYEPSNCRFVTQNKNLNNRRCTQRLSDGTPLAEFVSSFGIVTSDMPSRATKEYNRIRRAFKSHGEQSATTLVFDIALEQFADKHGFTYCKNALKHI